MRTLDEPVSAVVATVEREGAGGDRGRLILLSFLMLFVELGLIRWLGSNIVYLSYFSNFVLLGSFLGIGVGFLRAGARTNLFAWTPVALAVLVAFVDVFPVEIDRSGSELIYFGSLGPTGLPIWVTLPIVFVAAAAVMAMIAQGVARTFAKFEPLEAYRLDILGSIAGIAAFSLLAFLHAPPVAWGVMVALTLIAIHRRALRPFQIVGMFAFALFLAIESFLPSESWSPYYRVSTFPFSVRGGTVIGINVNGIPHQQIWSVEQMRVLEPIYFLPYERAPGNPLEDVLVVGAGSGNDVAIALSEGARRVDAVEIDPRLYALGRELHPNRPYDDPRVHVHVGDGRAFLEQTDGRYDLILFSLPDSLTLVAGQSSLRLESYLFTVEAMREAREHLRPGGAFAMYNYYREQWLIDRYARTLEQTYGSSPCIDQVGARGKLALLTASADPGALRCEARWSPASGFQAKPTTDDRPFPYLRTAGIPAFYLLAIALILLASVGIVRVTSGPLRRMAGYLDLFFMGAAFLLLETKNVVQFALLFGTTWFVNALVFAGILLSVLAAVEVARRVTFRRPALLYLALLAALAVAWAVPQPALLDLPMLPRFLAASVIAFAPVFLANLVFAQRFKVTASSTVAFGANLLGAMLGGVLEYASLLTGYRGLLVVVAALYLFAFLFGRRHLTQTARPEGTAPAFPSVPAQGREKV
jgi:SAM-dependent methyltransferase